MQDKITNQRIIVQNDSEHGPFISLNDYEQFDQLDDLLTKRHYVLYDVRTFTAPDTDGEVHQMLFGKVAAPEKVQALLDGIEI